MSSPREPEPGGDWPSASVVVPVRQGETVIGPLLESLVKLDYPAARLEVIVVDNASRDATIEVAARFPVKLLHEDRLGSSYAARNRGVALAAGEWVVFTDADCRVPPDWLRRLLAPPIPAETGAIAGEVLGLEGGTAVARLTEHYGLVRHGVTLPHKKLPCFSTACVAIRRSLLASLGGFREDIRFFGDMELSWRMQIEQGASILFRPEAAVRHRHRQTLGELWHQGVQHGRGVAFMKRTYPEHYRIDLREQVARVGEIGRSFFRALGSLFGRPEPADLPGAEPRRTDTERLLAPIFLALWYGGMVTGYAIGPAWTRPVESPRS